MLPSRSQSAPPLDFTHRLHFCGFHQHLALYIQPPAVRGEIGSDSPSLSTGTFPPLPTPFPLSTLSHGHPAHTQACLPTFNIFQHTHNLADKMLEPSEDAREHQNKLRPLWRSAPYCSPRCDVTFVQQPRVGHGYGGERGTLGEPACHALATSLAAPEISHCRDLVPADSHPPPMWPDYGHTLKWHYLQLIERTHDTQNYDCSKLHQQRIKKLFTNIFHDSLMLL